MFRTPSILAACLLLTLLAAPAPGFELVNQDGAGTWPVSCLTDDGPRASVDTCDGRASQQWSWSQAGELVAPGGECLSVYHRSYDENGNLVEVFYHPIFDRTSATLYPCDGLIDQRWYLAEGRIYAYPAPEAMSPLPIICLGFQRFAPAGGASRVIANASLADCDESFYFWGVDSRPAPAGGGSEGLFSFEDVAGNWSSPSGVALSSSGNATDGASAMAVPARGYVEFHSAAFGSGEMPGSGNRVAVDFFLPSEQPNAYWYGTLEVVFVVPSAGLWHEYLGLVDLLTLTPGQYHTLSFAMTPALAGAFTSGAEDVTVKLFLNVPQEATGLYLFDNLRRVP